MQNLEKLFKSKGMNSFVEALENALIESSLKINKLEERVRNLENEIVIASSLLVSEGASISPVKLVAKYGWQADDLGDMVSGLDAITISKSGVPTRWAQSNGNEIKFILPINLNNGCNVDILINSGTHLDVLKSILLYINEKRCNFKLSKTENSYLIRFNIAPIEKSSPSVLSIKYSEKKEGEQRHTIGINGLDAKAVSDE
jgi:hypothetical protein